MTTLLFCITPLEVSPPTEEFGLKQQLELMLHATKSSCHERVYLCLLSGAGGLFIHHICAQVGRSVFHMVWLSLSQQHCGNEGCLNLFVTAPFNGNNDFMTQLLCQDIELSRRAEGGGNGEVWRFESVYIRLLLCCSLECNMLDLVFVPVGFSLDTELWFYGCIQRRTVIMSLLCL